MVFSLAGSHWPSGSFSGGGPLAMSQIPKAENVYSDEETARRRDAVIKHMLNTPPKLHKEMKIGKRKANADAKPSPKKRERPREEKGTKQIT
jgi:hypothetical protein